MLVLRSSLLPLLGAVGEREEVSGANQFGSGIDYRCVISAFHRFSVGLKIDEESRELNPAGVRTPFPFGSTLD